MTPFGPTGRKVEPYKFNPVIIITIWDAWSLLWAYVHRPSRRVAKKMTSEEQINYMIRSLELLAKSLMIIQPVQILRPSTVNVTFSPHQILSNRKGTVIRCMFGASIRCIPPVNDQAAKSRVENMAALKCASNASDAITSEKRRNCRHNLGNCAESVPFEAMRGNFQHLRKRVEPVVLYTHTLALPRKKDQSELIAKAPCCKCTYIIEKMLHNEAATILPYQP
ncbi:hypothetical protein GLOIN_2v1722091 [Rhizophagus irregularis DAOM 181602=DAOM 197198]|uniref:Uncharacterized protein n=1 Tax=Rhizophagus irregularis (strain DAOM 181602 / DAOM 197198 / MUCL 43194) TaxID=747089 RepID=A0A2P4P210_RHIID|nr:hypothetical protein GLOIN_2v1722091 [Rhizophagus irregularis DAOM 181602=DAOM 197198]POG59433.1 hypothetical protein GLOIN_2v1722091 [Rhizophagus irregularis DAOM 181602=DAOM 197198]|eukprot:XP_025166299.1 hypothetical protein GLOIN_2v1722091 [Rhizophagus irregularis DAOM 181602=DAOM 197198]